MSGTGQYLLSVTCAGIACGISVSVSAACEYSEKLVKTISGVILCLICFSPILRYDTATFGDIQDYLIDADFYAEEGKKIQASSLYERITGEVCAYIEGVAEDYGSSLHAEVLMEDNTIQEVSLYGQITPNQRRFISQRLEKDLNIGDGQIKWNP